MKEVSTMPTPEESPATKADLEDLKHELLTAFLAAFKELREYVDERTHDAETRLLRAFGDYQQAQTTRFRHMKPISAI